MMFCVCFHKQLIRMFFLNSIHVHLVIISGSLQDMLDLSDSNYWEEFREQEVACKEQPKRSQVKPDFPDRWCVIGSPTAGQVITVK